MCAAAQYWIYTHFGILHEFVIKIGCYLQLVKNIRGQTTTQYKCLIVLVRRLGKIPKKSLKVVLRASLKSCWLAGEGEYQEAIWSHCLHIWWLPDWLLVNLLGVYPDNETHCVLHLIFAEHFATKWDGDEWENPWILLIIQTICLGWTNIDWVWFYLFLTL